MQQLEGRGGRLQGEPLAITSPAYCELRANHVRQKSSMISTNQIAALAALVSDPQSGIPTAQPGTPIAANSALLQPEVDPFSPSQALFHQ
jgi:hypothetical protein